MLKTILIVLLLAAPLQAEVVRIQVTSRADITGKTFGKAGVYEKLSGKMYFAADPRNSANQIIADIDKAPRNAAGKVEFSSDFYMVKPKDATLGNGTLVFEVSNRGGRGMIGFFNRDARGNDPVTADQLGDGFLMEQGFTLLWVGWQFDVPEGGNRLRVEVPIAREPDGRPIHGLVRSELPNAGQTLPLADRNHIPYAVADANDPANVLTVRDCVECSRRIVPRDQWKFAEDGKSVSISTGQPLKIYELVYKSQNPAVVGLGPAAVRDAVSRLKYDSAPELSIPRGAIKRAIGFGISQSGRFLRTYVYYGFNEDEGHRKVFDGVMPHVAGSGRGSFNHRFAQPSRDAHPYINFFYPTDIFPFSDVAQLDPETKMREGLMTRPKADFLPKVFYTNSSYEYWGRSASLVHTTIDGLEDVQMMANVRAYLFSGGQHGAGGQATVSAGQQMNNPLDYRWGMRKLLVDMNRWITDGAAPPPSAYPRVDSGALVMPDKLKFPKIPSVNGPGTPTKAYRSDYGPDFLKKGIVTQEPAKIGSAFPIMVPQVDKDGNEFSGIRMPELAVPLATYTGWNMFNDKSGPPEILTNMLGSFIPFPKSRADRERTNDPRASIEERYQGRDHYLSLVTKAAEDLAGKGYILKEDIPRIVEQAGTRWDFVQARK